MTYEPSEVEKLIRAPRKPLTYAAIAPTIPATPPALTAAQTRVIAIMREMEQRQGGAVIVEWTGRAWRVRKTAPPETIE